MVVSPLLSLIQDQVDLACTRTSVCCPSATLCLCQSNTATCHGQGSGVSQGAYCSTYKQGQRDPCAVSSPQNFASDLVAHTPGRCWGFRTLGVPALQCSIDGLPLPGPVILIHCSTDSTTKSFA